MVPTFSTENVTWDYDVVLMDMQMPVLDGLEATRLIRAQERRAGVTPTPIIALTANAFRQDVAASLAAGCDAHLAKPINRELLLDTLLKHPKAKRPTARIDRNLEKLIPAFLERRHNEVDALRTALDQRDLEALRTMGHTMMGMGGSYGFNAITDIGAAIETASKEHHLDAVGPQIEALKAYLAIVVIVYV